MKERTLFLFFGHFLPLMTGHVARQEVKKIESGKVHTPGFELETLESQWCICWRTSH